MLLAAALPMTRGFFNDARVPADAPGWERLYQTVIRIPVGTVVFEELAFRGVLLAVLCRRLRLTAAVGVNSALFGLWHIVPTLSTATANDIEGLARVGLVAGSVLATAVGGVVFLRATGARSPRARLGNGGRGVQGRRLPRLVVGTKLTPRDAHMRGGGQA